MSDRGIPPGPRAWFGRVQVRRSRLVVPSMLAAALLFGCTDKPASQGTGDEAKPPACPTAPIRKQRAPDVRLEHERAEFWLAKLAPGAADAELLDADARESLAERVAALPGGWRDPASEAVVDPALIREELGERLEFMRGRVLAGKYIELEPGALERAAARIDAATALADPSLHFVIEETPLWCVPSSEGLYTPPADLEFDRNRCASLHPGEYVRALRRTPDGEWTYVDAGHSVGWIQLADARLEPAITVDALRERLGGPQLYLTGDYAGFRHGSHFPLVRSGDASYSILVPGRERAIIRTLSADAPVSQAPFELTRQRLFTQAFSLLEQPYGWGGRDGQRDCSRYLLDLFALFDVRLPRNSGVQAELGTRSVDLSPLDEQQKREAIRTAAQTGVVLLYMPGHIMLYLGHDGDHDYGISALSEYLEPCPGGPDTVYKLDKVAVTTLELGRDTERRAFIERITRMAIFGPDHPN